MRGHWTSQTRRLNKHYQSGGILPPSPTIWRWAPYIVGGSPLPFRFDHDPEYDSPYKDPAVPYYNRIWNDTYAAGNPYGGSNYSSAEYAKCQCWVGPVADSYDGMIKPGFWGYENMVGTPIGDWYAQETALRKRPIHDPDYSSIARDFYIYRELGKRFVKFHVPKWSWAPSYWYGPEGSLLFTSKAVAKADAIFSDIRISARACKAFCFPNSDTTQTMPRHQSVDVTFIYGEDSPYIDFTFDLLNGAYDTDINIYDLEVQGLPYVEADRDYVRSNIDGSYHHIKVRVYCFIYDGDYYIDLMPHILDYDTEQPIDLGLEEVYISHMSFPSALMGYCYAQAYVQSDHSFSDYPSYTSIKWDPTDLQMNITYLQDGTCETLNTTETLAAVPAGGTYGVDNTLPISFQYPRTNGLTRVYDVTQLDFTTILSAWQAEHTTPNSNS